MLRDDPTRFVGSIPDHYDNGLGPVIFDAPAEIAARRVASMGPSRVLETAAGTGIVTRRLRDALPAEGEGAWMKYAGFVASGDPNSSQSIDDLVYGSKD